MWEMGLHWFLRKAKSEGLGTAMKHGVRDIPGNILHGSNDRVCILNTSRAKALCALALGMSLDSSQVSELRK